ncbi:putative integral membrane protein [Pseudarthrobacter phenanthrenivorans Sphe3]|uniref:Putative integral membrane protein n=1 Tax=Pseudarthrobacter phenanthrenivorans (strain DSM 18606 / JCM 16027 / LMG 23796 / Sphe3) TaxID=930171 RepID=F0MA65_PSEPM|nr:glycosyltransferase 87 family protein [Pseudarthrobacter phenanthrenivorans]ADX75052.1 putative integral membrane protein [Pseudarthrobacter phenanthrenivorans Sphe3]
MQETQPPEHHGRSRLVVPSRSDVLLRNFTELVGGPLGAKAAPGVVSPGVFTVERVLVILTVTAALLGILLKGYCRANGWDSPTQFYATCYSDFPEVFRSRGLAEGTFPILGGQFEYPVLIALIAGVTAWLVPGTGLSDDRVLAYFDINAALLAAVTVVAVLATARMSTRRPWDAAMVALAPGIVLAGTINWDLWAVALLAVGMYFFARERLVPAGIFIGLAVSANLYPLLILAAMFLLALRTGRFRPLLKTTAAAAAAWLAANLPFAVANPAGWLHFFQFSADRDAGYGSPWFAYNLLLDRLRGQELSAGAVDVLSLGFFAVSCALIALVALTAPRRPRLAQLAFLIVAAFILTNKVYSPQFVVWLVPLLALARPRWRDFLVWQGVEGLHWAAVWMYLGQVTSAGSSQHNLDMPYYVLAVAAHMAAVAYLMARVTWDIYDPTYDPIRRHHLDDPHGGPFNGAPDRFRLHPRRSAGSTVPGKVSSNA